MSVLNDGYGGGYLSGEDERGGHGGVDAAADRDGGVVLTEDEGGVHVDGVGREDSGQDSVSLETVEDSFSGGEIGGGYLPEVEVHREDERGELGGGGADPEQGGDGLGGGVGLGGGGRVSRVGIGGGG